MQANDFSNAPANAISQDGTALRFLHAHAETADGAAIGANENEKRLVRFAAAVAIRRLKIRAAEKPAAGRKIQRRTFRPL